MIDLRLRWVTFINLNYRGFSASTVILLSDFESDCERDGGSELECYTSSGDYILDAFGFSAVNPYFNIAVSTLTLVHLFYTLEEPDPARVSAIILWLSLADPNMAGHVLTLIWWVT